VYSSATDRMVSGDAYECAYVYERVRECRRGEEGQRERERRTERERSGMTRTDGNGALR